MSVRGPCADESLTRQNTQDMEREHPDHIGRQRFELLCELLMEIQSMPGPTESSSPNPQVRANGLGAMRFRLWRPRPIPRVRLELGTSGPESSPLTKTRDRKEGRPGTDQDDGTTLRPEPELVDERQFLRNSPTRCLIGQECSGAVVAESQRAEEQLDFGFSAGYTSRCATPG
jgi:hypothetical protein